jgi:hypothetical protein
MKKLFLLTFTVALFSLHFIFAQNCVKCHEKITPNIVSDWKLSEHS